MEACDECNTELLAQSYIRVQVWGELYDTFERVFCSPHCAKEYMKEWNNDIFYEVTKEQLPPNAPSESELGEGQKREGGVGGQQTECCYDCCIEIANPYQSVKAYRGRSGWVVICHNCYKRAFLEDEIHEV